MTELRLDPTIRNWVIVAPERSKRPDARARAKTMAPTGMSDAPSRA